MTRHFLKREFIVKSMTHLLLLLDQPFNAFRSLFTQHGVLILAMPETPLTVATKGLTVRHHRQVKVKGISLPEPGHVFNRRTPITERCYGSLHRIRPNLSLCIRPVCTITDCVIPPQKPLRSYPTPRRFNFQFSGAETLVFIRDCFALLNKLGERYAFTVCRFIADNLKSGLFSGVRAMIFKPNKVQSPFFVHFIKKFIGLRLFAARILEHEKRIWVRFEQVGHVAACPPSRYLRECWHRFSSSIRVIISPYGRGNHAEHRGVTPGAGCPRFFIRLLPSSQTRTQGRPDRRRYAA